MSKAQSKYLISDELWQIIEPLIPPRPPHPLGCHRPRVADRDAMNAIFFVFKTNCQWQALNATGTCTSSSAHRRFQEWRKAGVFEALWALSLDQYAELKGIQWRWQALDGATTKAPLGGKKTGPNPTDRAKLGSKRSLWVDGRGLPLGIALAGANWHDSQLLEATIKSSPIERPEPKRYQRQNLCLGKAFDSRVIRRIVKDLGFTTHIRSRGEERKLKISQRGYRARRWVVERTHSWFNRYRALLIRWSKKAENHLALHHFAAALIIFNFIGIT